LVIAAAVTAPLLAMLDTDDALVMAGVPTHPLTAPVGLLIDGRRSRHLHHTCGDRYGR
jgi:hypothetical protein